jgi:predicted double-glycine peptidase
MMRLANANPTTGTSLRGMESAAAAKSLDSGSFRMDFKTLQSQMEQFKTPVIVRMLNPEPHFAVVLDVEGPEVGLADPAVGNILISRKAFLKRWLIPGNNKEGYVFVAATPIGHVNSGNLAAARRDLARMRRALQTTRPPMFSPTR